MKTYTYHKDIRMIAAILVHVFDGIRLKRLSPQDQTTVVDEIAIPVYYKPKSRVIHDMVNLSRHIKLPILSFQFKSIDLDLGRAHNKNHYHYSTPKQNPTGAKQWHPVPVKIAVEATFIARFLQDIDQFISCIFSQFFPYIEISYKDPNTDAEVRCKFRWTGNVSINSPDDLNASTPYRIEANASFEVETFLFRNTDSGAGLIRDIHLSFTAVDKLLSNPQLMKDSQDIYNTDFLDISGRPIIDYTPDSVIDINNTRTITVNGDNFDSVSAVAFVDSHYFNSQIFLSGDYQEFDSYSDIKDLSAKYPAFTGVSADFEILNNNQMILYPPAITGTGWFDVWGMGTHGIGKLTLDSHRAYMTTQPTSTSGIRVVDIREPTITQPFTQPITQPELVIETPAPPPQEWSDFLGLSNEQT